ncbi:MAG: cation-translocating P-type ATPase, partial [Candidatus Methanomethylophilus sp.]|nr:cation-translocating P-type ATPase [Methanomethylophilus sp.]
KVARIVALKEDGHVVCMIGDGINDAPSLKAADVGIAMGGTGSGITVGVADMVIVGDEVGKVPHLQFLTKKMLGRIKINIAFGMSWNAMAVALAVTGTVGAVMGAIIHNVGSVAVVISSFLLLFAGRK